MANVSLESLVKPLTVDEAKTSVYNVLAAVGVSTTGWFSGAVIRTMITAVAIIVAAFSVLLAEIAKSGFLDLATGAWLTLVARYVYGVERIQATFATGALTLNNAGGGVYNLDPGDLLVVNQATGAVYRNTEAISLGATSSLIVTIQAVEAGSGGTAAPATITAFESPAFPATVTCTNATAIVGRDEEGDPALRVRCREKTGAVSPNGPKDAYAFFAKAATLPDGTPIGVNRVRVTRDGFGNVTTYVATPAGGVLGDVDDPETPLGAIVEALEQNAAPINDTVFVASATPKVIGVSYAAYIYSSSGLTEQQVKDAIALRLSEFMASELTAPIGGNIIAGNPGKIFADAIRGTIQATRPEIFHVDLTTPAADVELLTSEVPTLGSVFGTINFIEPGRA